ncbi:MAG: hypothetical protein HYZ74_04865, partial [Elusimicrobia bacterium]|nr:hypothetical protein [Elusimicrobiota bacterium]
MRRVLASILAAACLSSSLPAPAVAQFKARASMVPPASAPVGLAPLSNAVGAGTFTGVAAPATSLTPSLLVPSAVTLSVPAGPAAAAASARVVKGVHALGASAPVSALAEGAARLSAASAPDRPPEDGKKAGDETFSGAKPEDGGESSVAGRSSEHRSGLVPATPQPAKKESLVERWKKMAVNGAGPLIGAAFAWNFLTQAAYGILNPARDALLGVKIPADKLPLVFMASAA